MYLTIRSIINNVQERISKALLLSVFVVFTVGHSNAHAQTNNADVLLPIINFLLADEAVQCPIVTEETTLFTGVSFSSSSVDVDIIGVNPSDLFDPTNLGEFIGGANFPGTTTAEQILESDQGDINVEEVIRILSQDDVNALEGITKIVGSLSLNTEFNQQSELDLSPLNSLVEVTGDVFFRTNNANINGFKCLAGIGGDLNIQGNDNITSVEGFQSLEFVGGSLLILANDSVNSIGGFALLSRIQGDLSISSNRDLKSIDGFGLLESIGGGLFVFLHEGLENLDGFPLLESVANTLQVSTNTNLENIDGFDSLNFVGSELNILTNDSLQSVVGFESLELIGGSLNVQTNAVLESIEGLAILNRDNIEGDILITNNTSFDCANPAPSFLPTTFSSGNAIDCPQDLQSSRGSISSDSVSSIPSLGSTSSSIQIPIEAGISGVVSSLTVGLDITHSSVGDLTVTLSNGTTTINLIDRPTPLVNDNDIAARIANECAIDLNVDDNFLSEELGGRPLVSGATGGEFDGFASVDLDCVRALLNEGDNNDGLLAAIASGCIDSFPEDDFLSEVSSVAGGEFLDFASIDTDCAFDLLRESNDDDLRARVEACLQSGDDSASFPVVDTACVLDVLNEGDDNEDDLTARIVSECFIDSFSGDDLFESEVEAGPFDAFSSVDFDCVFTLLNASNDDDLAARIEGCLQSPSVDGSASFPVVDTVCVLAVLNEGGVNEDDLRARVEACLQSGDDSASFPVVDTACVLAVLNEDSGQFCSSNDIVVNLSDDASLLPINSSCSAVDSETAFTEPSYSSLQLLSAFDGSDINSNWTLTVTDSEGGNAGSLNGWNIVFDIDR